MNTLNALIKQITDVQQLTFQLGTEGNNPYIMTTTSNQKGTNQIHILKVQGVQTDEILKTSFHIQDIESMRKARQDLISLRVRLEREYNATA